MEIAGVVERVERIGVARANPSTDADLIESGLVAVRVVQAWCDAQHAVLVAQLREVDSFPEQRIAKASKRSLGQAARTTDRAKTLNKTPNLADALNDGAITGDHIDAVTRASKKVNANKRDQLLDRANALADVAKAGTVDEFARRLDLEAKRLHDDDGMDRLGRQRRSARARSWVDSEGMWNLLPVCSLHHGRIHNDDWVIELGPNRELTLRLPDGTIRATGPPTRHPTA